ncbi:MAG TPA: hypothetical protein VEC99_05495 [Clostridia bacterium]|nr:hypothetical protein [Clostridia bacterium]
MKTHKVVRELARKGIVEQLVWSPDGKWFVGTANGLGQFWNIGLVHGTTGEVRALSETERYNCTPDWAPDSQHVVYARGIIPEKGGHAELWIASINGKERFRAYAEPDHHIYGACVSPDGKYLLFTRSVADLGRVNGTTMAIIRCPDLTHPATNSNSGVVMLPRIDLEPGWEPHWTQSAPGAAWNLIILSDGNQNHHESSSSAR